MRNRNLSFMLRHSARLRSGLAVLCASLLACGMPAVLGGCGGTTAGAPEAASIARALPALPQDGPATLHRVSAASILSGYPAHLDSGAPNVAQHATIPEVLTLDSTSLNEAAREFTWAIWRLQLSAGVSVDDIKVTTYKSGTQPFYAGVANYGAGLWQLEQIQVNGASLNLPPEIELHSPGESVYIAIVVMAPQIINVQALDITTSGGTGNDPIFDAFEPNDPITAPWHMEPGYYHASIHETFIPEMGGRDKWDFYTVTLGANQSLTATLDYEAYDHLWAPGGEWLTPNYNDLDVLIYPPGSELPYDDFIEDASGLNIYYYAADQGFKANISGDYIIGILGDVSDPFNVVDNNAEYDLGIYVSDATHTVSGKLTHDGADIDKSYLVYLEYTVPVDGNRGFFNALATIDTAPHGKFSIRGVPDGEYRLWVRSSGAFYPYPVHPYVWQQWEPVSVAGADVTANINIEGEP